MLRCWHFVRSLHWFLFSLFKSNFPTLGLYFGPFSNQIMDKLATSGFIQTDRKHRFIISCSNTDVSQNVRVGDSVHEQHANSAFGHFLIAINLASDQNSWFLINLELHFSYCFLEDYSAHLAARRDGDPIRQIGRSSDRQLYFLEDHWSREKERSSQHFFCERFNCFVIAFALPPHILSFVLESSLERVDDLS